LLQYYDKNVHQIIALCLRWSAGPNSNACICSPHDGAIELETPILRQATKYRRWDYCARYPQPSSRRSKFEQELERIGATRRRTCRRQKS